MKKLVESLKISSDILYSEPWLAEVKKSHSSAQAVVVKSMQSEIYIPCITEALSYFHGIKTADSSANVIQAQRDYFGAHTYKRKDDPSDTSYHSDWGS